MVKRVGGGGVVKRVGGGGVEKRARNGAKGGDTGSVVVRRLAELPEFTPAQESLFLTLGSRALDSRLPRPFLGDAMSDVVLSAVGYDLGKFPTLSARGVDPRTKVFDVAVRTTRLDEMVRQFLYRHPNAVVLDLGAGLDGRVFRVDPPDTADWYDIDYPDVVELRREVMPARANAHGVGADLTDPGWLSDIPAERPAMLVADGLLPFLAQGDFVTLLNRLTAHFPHGELALNGYSTYATWIFRHTRAMAPIVRGMINPGFNEPRRLEGWVDRLRLVEEIFLTRTPEVADLPPINRWASCVAGRSVRASRVMRTMVLRYRF